MIDDADDDDAAADDSAAGGGGGAPRRQRRVYWTRERVGSFLSPMSLRQYLSEVAPMLESRYGWPPPETPAVAALRSEEARRRQE